MVVWERSKTVQPDNADLNAAYLNSFEIAFSTWDGSAWSAPALLADNTVFDHAPILARGSDGRLLLVWQQNPAGELIGNPANPDTFYFAVWDGSAWGTPQVLMADAQNILGTSAARMDGSTMVFAYSQDTDGDMSTSADQELFLMTWDGCCLVSSLPPDR